MLVRDKLSLRLSFWPSLFGHCLLTSFFLFIQCTVGELQKSCTRAAEKVSENCPVACQCRPYPPLPPPPPPPPPPRLLVITVSESNVPPMEPWWKDTVVLGTVGCASVAFLLLTALICYKAIKRKPLRKEENGTSRREYAMSSRSKKLVDTNNTGV
ncbi:proline-rich membrane anchor 1-like isoform X1 [Megalops cyprinoides]|uniref:proline-rich membrane anchor 1-like isoform X1 n=1 Tax=Megalops cyprinoides TaxID=118141 RepID=UPI001863B661|nr:proline-rich membrane anchor 1-like isoform X1 [Megalops cyprinoides]